MLLQNAKAKKPAIGLTPLIDVVFILLIFFMLVMNFQRYQVQDISVAQRAVIAEQSDALIIEIINSNDCRYAHETRSCLEVAERLPKHGARLLIRYKKTAKLDDIIKWYQYFNLNYHASLAVPITSDDLD